MKEKKEEDDDELTFDLSDNDEEDPNREKGAAGDDGEEEIEQTETTREREEKLMEMIYECGTAKEVAAYIDSLESTLLAARGREYQLRIEEKRGTTSKTETNPSAMVLMSIIIIASNLSLFFFFFNISSSPSFFYNKTKIIDQLRNNISVDCLERGQSIEEEVRIRLINHFGHNTTHSSYVFPIGRDCHAHYQNQRRRRQGPCQIGSKLSIEIALLGHR